MNTGLPVELPRLFHHQRQRVPELLLGRLALYAPSGKDAADEAGLELVEFSLFDGVGGVWGIQAAVIPRFPVTGVENPDPGRRHTTTLLSRQVSLAHTSSVRAKWD